MSLGSKPGGQVGGAPVLPPPAFSTSAYTPRPGGIVGSLAVTMPAYVAGNVVVVNVCGNFLTAGDTCSAAGWTQDGAVPQGQRNMFAFHRIMNGSEGATVTFTFNNSFEQPFAIAATYTGTSGTEGTPPTSAQPTTATWTCGPITTLGPNRKIVAICFSEASDFGALNAGTKRVDLVDGGEPAMFADLTATTAGAYTMGGAMAGASATHSCLIALKP